MIWIIGGTSEARQLINRLNGKKEFVTSVATYSGAELVQGSKAEIGRMDYDEMVKFIRKRKITTIVDMSHPYALEVTQNAKAASEASGAEYIRFVRKGSELEGCIVFDSIGKCVLWLKNVKGCVFFTTGIKNIKDFEKVRGTNRFIYRLLPSVFSMQECVNCGIRMEDMIAILGPVSEALNYQMFKAYSTDYVVMKDSGREGGTSEKISACKRLGITPIVISRLCEEDGIENLEKLIRILFERRTNN